jgi:cell migration-inducing and hyaluronan-binding protein
MPDFPIRGYEYYDYRHDVENTTFVNYTDNATRKTGALSYLMYTSAGVSTENAIEGAKFVNAKPVHFPPMVYEWGNDHLGSVAWKTAVFHDKDGSVGGVPDSYILIHDGENDSIATDAEACEIRSDWNAAVCRGDVGRLNIGGAGGGFGGGGAAAEPVMLSRNGRDFPAARNQSNVRAGTEVKVTTERPDVSLSLREMDEGSWVIFELPGFTTAASGAELNSLDALRMARDTSYFKDKDALWVKLVSNGESARGVSGRGPGGGTSIDVSR